MKKQEQKHVYEDLFSFSIPKLIDSQYRNEILDTLKMLSMCAAYYDSVKQTSLYSEIADEFEIDFSELDVDELYQFYYDELMDLVGGYNYFITENQKDCPRVKIVIDEEKTRLLSDSCEYKIFTVKEIVLDTLK